MQDTPFDNINDPNLQKKMKELTGMSSTKALKKEGFFMTGKLFQSKTTNIVKHFKEHESLRDLFRFNEWLNTIEYTRSPVWDVSIKKGQPITDTDYIHIKAFLAYIYSYEPNVNLIAEATFLAADTNKYHPVKNYLNSLKWDNKTRLDTWLNKVTNAGGNIYVSLVGKKFICAMIKRIYNPGCQFDNLIVFEGKQGIYKTTMLRILGGEWYAPFSIKAESKDAVDVMTGKWLLEMEELTAMKYGDIEHIKAFLSRTVDRVRLSYRRNAQDFPRQCVFAGTMNPIGDNRYFRDSSENRRFWPIECKGVIDINWLKENRDQLFAEAKHIYEQEALFLDNQDAIKISIEKQNERKPEDGWIDLILDYTENLNAVSLSDLLINCLHFQKEKINTSAITRIGICMRSMGWLSRKFGGKQKRYYVRPDISMADSTNITQELWENEEDE